MITFSDVNGQRFRMWWKYFIPVVGGKHEATTCKIESLDRAVLYEHTVTRHSSDKDCKETARKFSLKRVLEANFDKESRANAWNAYFTR